MELLDRDCRPEVWVELGGKGRRLRELSQAGLPVPAWVCLPAAAFREALRPVWPRLEQLRAGLGRASNAQALAAAAESAAALLADLGLPAAVADALGPALKRLDAPRLAVRSSALGEDGSRHAFAGLFATRLQVAPADVPAGILACWRSAFGLPALSYLVHEDLPLAALEMAVLIQVQIAADCAGIYFQASPDGLLNDQVIVAGYGLGEGIVSGTILSDSYRRDRFSGEWQTRIPRKPEALVAGPDGPRLSPVPEVRQALPVLSPEQRLELIGLCEKIRPAQAGAAYYDIEWCRDAQGWHLLQARPITTLPPGPWHYFDSSNIQESYPGVVLPLTASLVKRGYGANFTATFARLGFSRGFLASQQAVLAQMTAEFQGRLYYHMDHWHAALQWLPGARRLALNAFAAMIDRGPEGPAPPGPDALLGLRLYPILLARLLTLGLAMPGYNRRFEHELAAFTRLDPGQLSPAAMLSHFETHFPRLLGLAYLPLLNDLWTGLLTGLLRRRLQPLAGGPALLHELLGDLPGLASAAPLAAARALSAQARQDPGLCELLASQSPEQAWAAIAADPAYLTFYQGLQAFLRDFGGRSAQELKLEAPSYHEQPWRLLGLLQQAESPVTPGRSRALRQQAEAALARLLPPWHPQAWLLRLLLSLTRRALLRREIGRLDRTRSMAAARSLFRSLGRSLAQSGQLSQIDDIFYLRLEELPMAITSSATELARLIASRRAEYAAFADAAPRERLLMAPGSPVPQQGRPEPDGPLQGIGCAGAIAEGEALILHEPASDLDVSGKILVSLSTDPGWVFLMSRAAGLIVERGNLLSHAAIMARELGLPTVVGVAGATRALKDGERIRIDGRTGKVERVVNGCQ